MVTLVRQLATQLRRVQGTRPGLEPPALEPLDISAVPEMTKHFCMTAANSEPASNREPESLLDGPS